MYLNYMNVAGPKEKSFFKSTKGSLLIAFAVMTILIGIAAVAVHSVYKNLSEGENAVPYEVWSDVFLALMDDKKAGHLTRSLYSLTDAFKTSTKKDYPATHAHFETAVDEMSEAVGKNSPLTCLVITLQAAEEQANEKWSIVETLERRVLKALPDTKRLESMTSISRDMLANALEMQGKYNEAHQLYEDAVARAEKEDHSANKQQLQLALYKLTHFYDNYQEYDKAFDTEHRRFTIIQNQPSGEGGQLNARLAILLLEEAELKRKAHQFTAALTVYAEALQRTPADPALYSARGYMRKQDLHDFAGAISDYSKAISLGEKQEQQRKKEQGEDDDYGPANQTYFYYFRRAMAYMEAKDYARAHTDMAIACTKQPDGALMYARMAELESRAGNLQQALLEFDKAFKSMDKSQRYYGYQGDVEAAIYMLRGNVMRNAGRYKEALPDYEKRLQKAPGDARSYINRAIVFEHFGEHDKALTDYAAAARCLEQMEPKHILKDNIDFMTEWKDRMAVTLYQGRAQVYDALKQKKLADADKAKAKQLEAANQAAIKF